MKQQGNDKRRRALVIDDDQDMRELIAALLENISFDCDLVSDGIAALDVKQDYDAILVDMNMPIFDGERLLEYWSLTRDHLLKRVIVLTGFSRYVRARNLPETFGQIGKPFDYEKLTRLVQSCAEQGETNP